MIGVRLLSHFGSTIVLTLHRISKERTNASNLTSMEVMPDYFEWFVGVCRKYGWHFISVDELGIQIVGRKIRPKQIVITIDDGYYDNLEAGYYLFDKLRVPYCIFLTTSFIDDPYISPWWEQAEFAINSSNSLACFNQILDTTTVAKKREALSFIRGHCIAGNFSGINFIEKSKTGTSKNFLSWDDVRYMSRSQYASFGSHLKDHYSLKILDHAEAQRQIFESKEIIESNISKKISSIAYPYGGFTDCGDREFNMARKAGYLMGFTTYQRPIRSANHHSPFDLPRMDMVSSQIFKKLFLGLLKTYIAR